MSGYGTDQVAWAAEVAERHLAVLGDRWRHTQVVAERAEAASRVLEPEDRDILVAAAWLHDVGYGPEVRATGFHPLDGARYLVQEGADPRLCALVAHHSGARFEADQRELREELDEFPREDGPVLDALIYADMTTGPQGQTLTFDERMDEIVERYAVASPVYRAITAARPYLAAAVQRTAERLAALPA